MDKERALRQERWWVLNVLFYPREDDGRIKALPQRQAPHRSPEEKFVRYWTGLGVAEHRARALWKKQTGEASDHRA